MTNSNLPTNISEDNIMTNDQLMQQLVSNFLQGDGTPRLTDFDRFLKTLSREVAKPLFGHSGKTGGSSWRDEVKARFGGRGAKWVFVSLEEIRPTLDRLAAEGVDIEDYDRYTQAHGQAWIRFAGARMNDGKQCAAFEVRTEGSKKDHPKQLHFIPLDVLEETIRPMEGTPHSLKFETLPTSNEENQTEDAEPEQPEANETELLFEITGMEFESDETEVVEPETLEDVFDDFMDDDANDDMFA